MLPFMAGTKDTFKARTHVPDVTTEAIYPSKHVGAGSTHRTTDSWLAVSEVIPLPLTVTMFPVVA